MTPRSAFVASTAGLLPAPLHSASRCCAPSSMHAQLKLTHWCLHFEQPSDAPSLYSSMNVQIVPHRHGRSLCKGFCKWCHFSGCSPDSRFRWQRSRPPSTESRYLDRHLNLLSHYPLSRKKSVVTSLLSRAKALPSTTAGCAKEEIHVTMVLKGNGYPASFIRCSAPALSPTPTQEIEDTDVKQSEKQTAVTFLYFQGLLELINRILEQLKVTMRFRPDTTLWKVLVRPKDPVPPRSLNGIIYRIPCRDCGHAYLGQSGCSLSSRVKEHQRAVRNGDINASALVEHA